MSSKTSSIKPAIEKPKVQFKRMSPEEWRVYKREKNAAFDARKEERMTLHEKILRDEAKQHRKATKIARDNGEWIDIIPSAPMKKKAVLIPDDEPTYTGPKGMFGALNDDEPEEVPIQDQTNECDTHVAKRLNWADECEDS